MVNYAGKVNHQKINKWYKTAKNNLNKISKALQVKTNYRCKSLFFGFIGLNNMLFIKQPLGSFSKKRFERFDKVG